MEISNDEKFQKIISIVQDVVENQKDLSDKWSRILKTCKFLGRRLKTGMTYLSEHQNILLNHGFYENTSVEQVKGKEKVANESSLSPFATDHQFLGIYQENLEYIKSDCLPSPFELQQISKYQQIYSNKSSINPINPNKYLPNKQNNDENKLLNYIDNFDSKFLESSTDIITNIEFIKTDEIQELHKPLSYLYLNQDLDLIQTFYENDDQSDCDVGDCNPISWAENDLTIICLEYYQGKDAVCDLSKNEKSDWVSKEKQMGLDHKLEYTDWKQFRLILSKLDSEVQSKFIKYVKEQNDFK